ncbi:MAG: GNAT family N-acetyltransferase [Geminicoccaceae bacterium]
MTEVSVREPEPGDIPALVMLNNAAVPAVNRLSEASVAELLAMALWSRVAAAADRPLGWLLVLAQGAPYDSLNYRWFAERYDRFAYIDRAIVADEARGRGIGGHLYDALLEAPEMLDRVITCEVNERPPNPGSLRFHQRFGFAEVGRQETEGGAKAVILMARPAHR